MEDKLKRVQLFAQAAEVLLVIQLLVVNRETVNALNIYLSSRFAYNAIDKVLHV